MVPGYMSAQPILFSVFKMNWYVSKEISSDPNLAKLYGASDPGLDPPLDYFKL